MNTDAPARRTGPALLRPVILATALPTVLLALWWVGSAGSQSPFFPPLSQILEAFGPTWFDGRFTVDVVPSLGRLLLGYGIAVVIGVIAGLLIGAIPALRATAEPVLEFLRAIPPPVLVPILMLFFGIGPAMQVIVIATGCIWPVLLNTVEGVRGIDSGLRDVARIYRFRPMTKVRTVLLRGASPQIVVGARQALSIGIILMVISEMFAAVNGIGFSIVQFQRSFALPEMWTGILLLGLIGIVLSLLFRLVETRILAWYAGARRNERGAP